MQTLMIPLPVREAVADILGDLLGTQVMIERATNKLSVPGPQPITVANFSFDSGRLAGVGLSDQRFGAYAGAALAQLPKDIADDAAKQGLDEDLNEFLYEVLNVVSRLLNSSSTPHVVLRDMITVPGEQMPGDTRTLVAYPAGRQDYLITIEGYGAGQLSLLSW